VGKGNTGGTDVAGDENIVERHTDNSSDGQYVQSIPIGKEIDN
jgi:hypothetical protein